MSQRNINCPSLAWEGNRTMTILDLPPQYTSPNDKTVSLDCPLVCVALIVSKNSTSEFLGRQSTNQQYDINWQYGAMPKR